MRIAFFGVHGKMGAVIVPALESRGHEVLDARSAGPDNCDAAVDFTRPNAVVANIEQCLAAGVPVVMSIPGLSVMMLERNRMCSRRPQIMSPVCALMALVSASPIG